MKKKNKEKLMEALKSIVIVKIILWFLRDKSLCWSCKKRKGLKEYDGMCWRCVYRGLKKWEK